MRECPYCSSTHKLQVKSGRNRSGTQRYKCQCCQRIYTPQPKIYDEQFRLKAVWLFRLWRRQKSYQQHIPSAREVAVSLGINHQTLINWVNLYEGLEVEENFVFLGYSSTERTNKFRRVYRVKDD